MSLTRLGSRLTSLVRPLSEPAFRRLWVAQVVSEMGDWAARLALTVLVYTRTGSTAAAGAVVAASLVPWLGPGQLLTRVSERWPRRWVMVCSDLVRAAAFAVAALPLPIPVLLVLVFVAGLATPPFAAARSAIRPEIVPAALFGPSMALTSVTEDLTVALGYAAGGGLVALLGAPGALLCNAASFAVSAVVLAGLPQAAPARSAGDPGGLRRAAGALVGDPVIARAVVLVTAAMVAGTGLTAMAAPLVLDVLKAGPGTAGLLVALTSVVSIAVTAAIPVEREATHLLRWAAYLTCLGGGLVVGGFVLAGWLDTGQLAVTVVAYAGVGVHFAVLAPANVIVSPRLPAAIRASAFSLLMGALTATEAAAALGAGLAAAAVGLAPACAALGVPALVVGGWALARPVSDPASVIEPTGVQG